jgi:hypothetical protein
MKRLERRDVYVSDFWGGAVGDSRNFRLYGSQPVYADIAEFFVSKDDSGDRQHGCHEQ